MLVSLIVKNFAIIDNLQIDFKNGMSVLTGETGAGKSLIIDAIGLLFGKRASNEMIRFGETKATIEGVFSNFSSEINIVLENLGIELSEEDNLVIKREIYNTGKSICRINNTVVSLTQLLEISEYIGDIHSQSDTIGLINPKNYLKFITNNDINDNLKIYANHLKEYRQNNKDYLEMLEKSNDTKSKEDFLKYQLNEFEQAKLSVEEEQDLKNEFEYLSNFENISESINEINKIYHEEEVIDKIYQSLFYLQKLEKYDDKFKELYLGIEECYYSLEGFINNSKLKLQNFDFDNNRLEEVNTKLAIYSDFKRKYKKDTNEIIAYFQKINKDLDLIENYDLYLKELKSKTEDSYIKALTIAKDIRAKRIKLSMDLSVQIKSHLHDLQLKNCSFEIKFNEIEDKFISLKNDGIDEVDFLVSFNKGEPVKPLSKTASGGEMSRFMLALKTVLGDAMPLQTKIFDEIDNGVSGSVAYSIAEKIKFISKESQVLCITHLPQVASICDHHYKISKMTQNDRTFTNIIELNDNEKVLEIASMISKGNPTEASINLAKELLSTATNF
jgi:DNA repair protein RecN (Recombination protein N)